MSEYYYEIAPADPSYKGSDGLTYHSDSKLSDGQIVQILLRNKPIAGFVVGETTKPSFQTKTLTPKQIILPSQSLRLFSWMSEYYPRNYGATASLLLPPLGNIPPTENRDYPIRQERFKASTAQLKIVSFILAKGHGTFIVHGATGAGKTKIYLDLAADVIKKGKSVLILVPEISLSPQLYKEFTQEFGQLVMLYHSGLTPKEKRRVWYTVHSSSKPVVIVGPRSCLFLPYKKLGLVVIDEFHEQAYKQESAPYYYGLRVASVLATSSNSPLVLGSATPPINEYFWATKKGLPILNLSKRSLSTANNQTISKIVDLSSEKERTKYTLLSKTLIDSISKTLSNKEQALIFLNKRGSSRAIVCQECGWRSSCPNCNLPLTYHADQFGLICHTCGHKEPVPINCPLCRSTEIVFKSPGTKTIAEQLQQIFPNAKIARFDKDNKKSQRLASRHTEVVQGEIDILIGTQLLAKGHDLPKLASVGILQAEGGLQFPDYTSNERSYQLIHQLSGRVGRGHRPGMVIVQSFNPGNETIDLATKNDWLSFYQKELLERKKFEFPPYYHMMKIEAVRATDASARQALNKIISISKQCGDSNIKLSGPSPCFKQKKGGKSYWQLIIKSKDRPQLVTIAKKITGDFVVDLDPLHLL